MQEKPLISVVVPVYNEETNIQPFYETVTGAVNGVNAEFEIIFIDDGSTDATFSLIEKLSKQDGRVKSLRFSRNFGSHSALLAGLRWASGDAAVIISVDLQDPPELIPELIRRWQEGFQVVWAVREGRDDPFFKKLFASMFYKLFRRIALKDFPPTGMDFGLFDRCVLDNLRNYSEVNFDITLVIVWFGFRQTQVSYYRKARYSGYSKWPLGKRIKSAIDLFVSFSYFPVRFISYTGIVISLVSFFYALFLIIGNFFFGIGAEGWPSLMVAVLFLGGVQLIMLGILGEYVWRGNDQVKGRPQYIVMEKIGFDHQSDRTVSPHTVSSDNKAEQ